jgi:hypothetical protein
MRFTQRSRNSLPVFAERELRETRNQNHAHEAIREDTERRRHHVEAPQNQIHSSEQKERPGEVAMDAAASRGID